MDTKRMLEELPTAEELRAVVQSLDVDIASLRAIDPAGLKPAGSISKLVHRESLVKNKTWR